jgi:transposase
VTGFRSLETKSGIEQRAGDQGIMEAYREHGYTMKQVAEHLGVHYATISRRLRKLEGGKNV